MSIGSVASVAVLMARFILRDMFHWASTSDDRWGFYIGWLHWLSLTFGAFETLHG